MMPDGFAAFVTTVFFTVSFIRASPELSLCADVYSSKPACYRQIGGKLMQPAMVGMTPLGFAAFVTTVFFTVSFICLS
jgi:hypothetical protein